MRLPDADLPLDDLPAGDLPLDDLPIGDLPLDDLPTGEFSVAAFAAGVSRKFLVTASAALDGLGTGTLEGMDFEARDFEARDFEAGILTRAAFAPLDCPARLPALLFVTRASDEARPTRDATLCAESALTGMASEAARARARAGMSDRTGEL